MARKAKKYHFIYKTTNILSGKYYIGMHSTDNLEDGYLGSGRRLKYSINKHGKENHVREIIEFLDSRKELKAMEEEIVNLNEISKEQCMNLKVGGHGGFIGYEHSLGGYAVNKLKKKHLEQNPNYLKDKYGHKVSAARKREWESGQRKLNKLFNFKGKAHSVETKAKMRQSFKGKGLGKNNSQYGSFWITNGIINKKLKKDSIIPEGWSKGRLYISKGNLL